MSYDLPGVLTLASAVCAGVTGGVYLGFAAIVMPALRSLPSSEAVATMQGINISAVKLPFMAIFFGGTAAALALIVAETAIGGTALGASRRLIGAGLVLASLGITMVRNVPLNNRLAQVPPNLGNCRDSWKTFDQGWSRANLLRATASIVATILFVDSLSLSPGTD